MLSRLRSRFHAHALRGAAAALGAGALVTLTAAGCGTAVAPAAATAPSPGPGSYQACLRQHGVTVPTARPTARPAGGSGAGNPGLQKARQACAALRPAGGFGGSGRFGTAFQAFRTCMAAHGEPIPATRPTAPPSPGPGRFLNGLNPGDPKVAAALKACQSKLPAFGGAPPAG